MRSVKGIGLPPRLIKQHTTMTIKTFTAKTMREALRRVQQELGPDATLLRTRQLTSAAPSGKSGGRPRIEITASGASESCAQRPLPVSTPAPVSPAGRAPHHYALRYPYQSDEGEVLLVLRTGEIPFCAAALTLKDIRPATGAYRNHPQTLYRIPGGCLTP